MEKVLVAGATGETGQNAIRLLKESNQFEPIAMIRKENQRAKFDQMGVATVMGDLTEDISTALVGMDRVIFAAGSKGKNLEEVDKKGARKMIDASKKERIKKFVMLSSMGADNPEKGSHDMQPYLSAKKEADEYLAGSGLNFTIVRPGALKNDVGIGKIELSKHLETTGGIPRADVARTLVSVLEDSRADREAFEIISGETQISEAVANYK